MEYHAVPVKDLSFVQMESPKWLNVNTQTMLVVKSLIAPWTTWSGSHGVHFHGFTLTDISEQATDICPHLNIVLC